MEPTSPLEWFARTPALLAGIAAWVLGWLLLELAWYRRGGPRVPHRSHHARDRREADRNYGGFFAIFDRLFGTWQANPPDYRPDSYGLPDWEPEGGREVAFGELRRFFRGLREAPGLREKLRYALTR